MRKIDGIIYLDPEDRPSSFFMKCGHTAQGRWKTPEGDRPSCVVCVGTSRDQEAITVEEEVPMLADNRMAMCDYCKKKVKSSFGLAFFEWREDEEMDRYYCGCRGWD